jgi:hypothetical protein
MQAGPITDAYPLTPVQQGMLFHSLFAPDTGAEVVQALYRVHEALDVPVLRRTWDFMLGRHPILRSAFRWEGLQEPVQEVHAGVELPWESHDWRALDEAERERRFQAYLRDDRIRGFEMSRPPLTRIALFRWTDAEYRLVWTFHHAVMDGRSLLVFVQEMLSSYRAFLEGREIDLPPACPYRAYVEHLRDRDLTADEAFWRGVLAGARAPTRLPEDFAPGTVHLQAGEIDAERVIRLSADTTASLEALAKASRLTMNTVAQGVWALLLARYSGEDEVIFGVTRAARRWGGEEIGPMVGLFIQTLPLRVAVPATAELLPWLHQVRAAWNAMRDHEHAPLLRIAEWSDFPRGTPLFESIIAFDHVDQAAPEAAAGAAAGAWQGRELGFLIRTSYPLTVTVYGGRELVVQIKYDPARFDHATAERMTEHFRALLEAIAADPHRPLSRLPMMGADERGRVVQEWNRTATDFPRDHSIVSLFAEQVAATPDAVAVRYGAASLTYAELDRASNRLARRLRALGVAADSRVALSLDRDCGMIVTLLAILKAGGAYVPLDPSYPAERLALMLEDAGAAALVSTSMLAANLPMAGTPVVLLDQDDLSVEDDSALSVDVDPDNRRPPRPEHRLRAG